MYVADLTVFYLLFNTSCSKDLKLFSKSLFLNSLVVFLLVLATLWQVRASFGQIEGVATKFCFGKQTITKRILGRAERTEGLYVTL